MINIKRTTKIPSSLKTKEIKTYIDDCNKYKDKEIDDKPQKPKSYRQSDLLAAFDQCFYSKCYLTEEKFTNSWAMDVEHLISQNEESEKVYEWDNLFPAEHKANMSKPRKTPEGGYLDPCNKKHNVEEQIIYSITNFGNTPNFDPSNCKNKMECNTAALLNRVHNGHDDNSIKSTATLRHAIHKKIYNILEKISEYSIYDECEKQRKVQLRNELKLLFSRKSSFTMLCRSLPAAIQLNKKERIFFD